MISSNPILNIDWLTLSLGGLWLLTLWLCAYLWRRWRSAVESSERAKTRLHHLALHDPLTELPNRQHLLDALERWLNDGSPQTSTSEDSDQALVPPPSFGILSLGIDRFRQVNESLGREAGDEALRAVADRLRQAAEPDGLAARLGGDEFGLVISGAETPDELEEKAEALLEELRQPLRLFGHEVFIGASLGLSRWPEDGREARTLLRNAETAKEQAKAQGRDRVVVYRPDFSALALEMLDLESDLRRALAMGEFYVELQPIFSIQRNGFDGLEALVRWQHPRLGRVAPGTFLPLADTIGLSYELDLFVLEEACRLSRNLRIQSLDESGEHPPRLAINLSARSLQHPHLARDIAMACQRVDFDPRWLELEITESAAMRDVIAGGDALHQLKTLGLRLSIDDFGTGYSSLAYLHTLPFDSLKIDRSFISPLPDDREALAIVEAILALARALNLEVVAEGVESADQLLWLRDAGCQRLQGFALARPQRANGLPLLFANSRDLDSLSRQTTSSPQRNSPPQRSY